MKRDLASDELVRADAAARLAVAAETITISRHEQVFSSTACGFPGLGGAMMTPAEVTVAVAAEGGACVYVTGRLCYLVREPNEEFQRALTAHGLLPASSYRGQYDHVLQPEEELFRVKESQREPVDFRHVLDLAYERARPGYGIKRTAKPATVVRASDGALICLVTPAEEGTRSPEFTFTPEAHPYQFAGRFPRIGELPAPADLSPPADPSSGLSFD